ncbi:MAG: hypothetical protein JJU41_12825 [Bacteroidetes bacterium]|nr:hypothetical protein [Bacteroidota bacterium]MCH8524883.1 hypothetical protein [Balneolales bacterium]
MNILSNSSGFEVLLLMMLAFATLAFTLLAMVTVSNAWRLRSPLITWKAGKLGGYPLFATIFLGFSVTASIIYLSRGESSLIPVMLCYSWIALTWFFSSYQMSKRYITDNGIVKNVNDPNQTVMWSAVSDYMEKQTSNGVQYTFFYTIPATPISDRKIARIELLVPDSRKEAFKKLLHFKLRRRFTEESVYAPGFKQFN